MTAEILIQSLIFGIFVGALYGLAAAGLSLVFGVMKMLNVAHGELLMLGGYATFYLFSLCDLDPFLSLVIAGPILFLIGMMFFKGLFGFLARLDEENKIKNSLLVGFGISLVLHNLAILLFTADERSVTPTYAGSGFEFFAIQFPYIRVGGLLLSILLMYSMHLFLNRTYFGKAIRATTENWQAATLMGINIEKTYLISFALGTAFAGIAGTIVSVGYAIHPAMGMEWTIKALIVIVLAGLGNIGGAFLAGVLLGAIESVSALFVGAYMEVIGLIIFVLVLELRPQGLFGR